MGKNVAENRNIGTTTSRMMSGKPRSVSCVIENAAMGAANAAAVNAAAGIARTPHGDGTAPSSAATTRNTDELTTVRIAVQMTNPSKMWRARIGVATTPS